VNEGRLCALLGNGKNAQDYAIHVREFAGSRKITPLQCKARRNALMTMADHASRRRITTMIIAALIIV